MRSPLDLTFGRGSQTLEELRAELDGTPQPIPEGAMRVAPGSDAVVWKVNPGKTGEL